MDLLVFNFSSPVLKRFSYWFHRLRMTLAKTNEVGQNQCGMGEGVCEGERVRVCVCEGVCVRESERECERGLGL